LPLLGPAQKILLATLEKSTNGPFLEKILPMPMVTLYSLL